MKYRPTILAWLFVFILMVGLTTTANAVTLSLEPSEDPAARGEIFYLDIVIDDPTGVAGCAFKLTYPADRLVAPDPDTNGAVSEITSVFFQQFQTTRMHRENISTEEILFSGANINASTGGAPYDSSNPNMILFTIPFTVLPDPGQVGQTITFNLEQTELLNADAGWGDGANPEPAPVLVGAVPNTDTQNWNDLTKAFPVLLGDQTNPFTTVTLVTSAIEDCTNSDQDDLCDSVETNTGTYVDPLNTGTDPNIDDSDGDGLDDGVEVYTHGTNPVNSDSDGDGMPDGWEVANAYNPNDSSEPLAQLVSTDPPQAPPGTTLSMDVYYTTSDDNQNLSGLELRIHYDSSKLSWDSFTEVLTTGKTVEDTQAQDDTADYDNDQSTDKYLTVGWLAADWPGAALPVKLFKVNFDVDPDLQDGDTSVINFSEVSTAAGYVFYSAPVVVDVLILAAGDVNGDENVNVGDAILVLRYSVGLTDLTDEECHAGNVTCKPGDRDINVGDAIKILRYSVGLIDNFDCQ